jgi:hypothetical protein
MNETSFYLREICFSRLREPSMPRRDDLHTIPLIGSGPIVTISLHACVEVPAWKKLQELREYELPVEHKTTLTFPAAENPPSRRPNVLLS